MIRVVRAISSRLGNMRLQVRQAVVRAQANRALDRAELDPRVSYPSYRSLDDFIDVERLRSLDGYLTERVRTKMANHEVEEFHTGLFRRRFWQRSRPGALVIPLTKSTAPFSYQDLNKPGLWEPTPDADTFSELMDFAGTMPFKHTARILIICEINGPGTTPHRDHGNINIAHEFIWFRSSLEKPLFMLNHRTGAKKHVESYSAWFDTVNQYHGSDPSGGLTFSLRVDGAFSDELRKQIPTPSVNPASTASLWACEAERSASVS